MVHGKSLKADSCAPISVSALPWYVSTPSSQLCGLDFSLRRVPHKINFLCWCLRSFICLFVYLFAVNRFAVGLVGVFCAIFHSFPPLFIMFSFYCSHLSGVPYPHSTQTAVNNVIQASCSKNLVDRVDDSVFCDHRIQKFDFQLEVWEGSGSGLAQRNNITAIKRGGIYLI